MVLMNKIVRSAKTLELHTISRKKFLSTTELQISDFSIIKSTKNDVFDFFNMIPFSRFENELFLLSFPEPEKIFYNQLVKVICQKRTTSSQFKFFKQKESVSASNSSFKKSFQEYSIYSKLQAKSKFDFPIQNKINDSVKSQCSILKNECSSIFQSFKKRTLKS